MLQEKGIPAAQAAMSTATEEEAKKEEEKPVKIDPRRFQCDTWIVSPNIRFLDKVRISYFHFTKLLFFFITLSQPF